MARFLCPVEGCKYVAIGRGVDLHTRPYASCSLYADIVDARPGIDDAEVNLGDGCVFPDVPDDLTYEHWLKEREEYSAGLSDTK